MAKTYDKFLKFHKENPPVYKLFCRFAQELIERGIKKGSAYAIMHRIRWETLVQTTGKHFKIANDHVPFYSRLWLKEHPRHPAFFKVHGGCHVDRVRV